VHDVSLERGDTGRPAYASTHNQALSFIFSTWKHILDKKARTHLVAGDDDPEDAPERVTGKLALDKGSQLRGQAHHERRARRDAVRVELPLHVDAL
jgi:hypothetical protein